MRLFIAIDLPEEVKDQIETLRADIPGATWVKRHAFHLTLRFLGDDINPNRLNTIQQALSSVKTQPFEIAMQGVGRFPPPGRQAARVLWVGTTTQPILMNLHRQMERAIGAIGFPPDDHAFSPHITIARLRTPKPSPEVDAFLAENAEFKSAPIQVEQFVLYSSLLRPEGPLYNPESVFPLNS
jgi:RNA 2',3'-cyclic 3'-phosphodiesterase